jgi:O-antigen ligase
MFELSELILAKVKANKIVAATVAGYAFLVLFHIPLGVLVTLFDKNQAPQFFSILILAAAFGLVILWKSEKIPFSRPALYLGFALLAALLLSALQGGNFFPTITGDTLRYAGIASNAALLLVALFHGLFTSQNFPKLVNGYLAILFISECLAVLQFFKVITLPGLQGNPTSTFGNLDFYAAFVGTSFPLILYAWLGSARIGKRCAEALALLSVICLRLVDAKQGYFDLAIAAFLVAAFILYRKYKVDTTEARYSINVHTTIATIALFIWLELIFLIPFIGKAIPFIGNDPQVAIRGVLWLAGINQFLSHPFLGVGPDQYGAYYEHYRTVNSTIVLPGDSSNDAHSATVQTLATTGIVGSLIFFLLIALVIRSILVILEREPWDKKRTYALSLFLFIYLTNAAISPIVLPHKYLLWAISGYLIFYAARISRSEDTEPKQPRTVKLGVALLTALTFFVGSGFFASQINFAQWGESRRTDAAAKPDVRISPLLPCHIYFTYLAGALSPQGDAAIEKLSRDQVAINPRCYEAQRMLAAIAYNKGDLKELKKQVDILIDLAPAQREVLDIVSVYATKAGDKILEEKVRRQLARMGVYTVQVG